MAERRSALARMERVENQNARVSLSELRPGSLLQVAAWPDTLTTVETVIRELLTVQVPQVGTAVADPNLAVLAIVPGRFLISAMAPDLAARFEAALPSSEGAVTDLAHGRVILRLEGDGAGSLLGSGVAIDLHPSVFPAGRVAQTFVQHIDILIHRRSVRSFDVWVLRGFAEALAEWLLDAGLEIGVRFD